MKDLMDRYKAKAADIAADNYWIFNENASDESRQSFVMLALQAGAKAAIAPPDKRPESLVYGDKVTDKQLRIGDVVRIEPGHGHDSMTVVQIKDGWVTLVRPYIHLGDFTHTGGVSHYVGVERFEANHGTYTWLDNVYYGPKDSEGNAL